MVVRVDRVGQRIVLRSAYSVRTRAVCKSVPGATWSKAKQRWTYPLSLDTCILLRAAFGDELEIGPDLWSWAAAEKAKRASMIAIGKSMDADLQLTPNIAPKMYQAMSARKYQRAGALYISEGRSVGVFDDPGLGKTVMTLSGLMESELWEGRHLCLAPKTALNPTWGRQIRRWTPGTAWVMPEGKANREAMIADFMAADSGANFLIAHPHMLQIKVESWCKKCDCWENEVADGYSDHWVENHKFVPKIRRQDWPELFGIKWDSILADEVQQYMLKIRPTGNGVKMPQWAEGLMRLQTQPLGVRVAMTGTPMRGLEQHIFGILHWLWPKEHASFWRFVEHYLHESSNGFGVDIGHLRADAEERFYDMLDATCLRRSIKECRPELPERNIVDIWVDMSPKQSRQYKAFEAEGEINLESGGLFGLGVLSELTRLRQLAFGCWDVTPDGEYEATGESAKVDWLIGNLLERGVNRPEVQGKYIVASQFTKVLKAARDRIEKELGIPTLSITGAVTGRARNKAEESFQNDPDGPRILFCQTVTGGVSLTLDQHCDVMYILDETWKEDDQTQLMGRINNRQGEIRPRWFYYIRTADTVEESIGSDNVNQANLQAQILDRRRGVEIALRLLNRESMV